MPGRCSTSSGWLLACRPLTGSGTTELTRWHCQWQGAVQPSGPQRHGLGGQCSRAAVTRSESPVGNLQAQVAGPRPTPAGMGPRFVLLLSQAARDNLKERGAPLVIPPLSTMVGTLRVLPVESRPIERWSSETLPVAATLAAATRRARVRVSLTSLDSDVRIPLRLALSLRGRYRSALLANVCTGMCASAAAHWQAVNPTLNRTFALIGRVSLLCFLSS
jgi:hypothetical protein